MGSDWRSVKLGEILGKKGYIQGTFGSALRRGELRAEGIPVYEQQHAINNIRTFRYFIDEDKFNELSRFVVKEHDLIISCSGTLGKVSVIREEDPKGIISQALLLLRPDASVITPNTYTIFYLLPKDIIRSRVFQVGASKRISQSVVSSKTSRCFCLPSPNRGPSRISSARWMTRSS